MNEREKTVENRYKSLLSESNKKSHSQEQLIRHLTESSNQRGKDLLLQVPNLFFLLYLTFDLAQFFWCCFFNSFCRSIYIKIRLAAMIITFITIYRCTLELSLCHLGLSHQGGEFGETEGQKREGAYPGSCD